MQLLYTATVLVLSSLTVDAWKCSDACALLNISSDDVSTMYRVLTNQTEYEPGSNIKVTLSSTNSAITFSGVIVQAKRLGDLSTTGSISTLPGSDSARLLDCARDTFTDTACFENNPGDSVSVIWRPPQPAGTAKNVEMQAIFFDKDGRQHRQHSVVLSENVKDTDTEDKPNLHDDKIEGEMEIIVKEKQEKDIQQENLATEDDSGKEEQKAREEHEKEQRWEETQYEIENKREEDERRARIQAEIADKEEYDRLMAEKEEKERLERERLELERLERERLERERLEREREERERKQKEQEERDRENGTKLKPAPGEEVDIDEKSNQKGQTAGSSKMAAVSVVAVLASLMVLFV